MRCFLSIVLTLVTLVSEADAQSWPSISGPKIGLRAHRKSINVKVGYTVGIDGRVHDCIILKPSGSPALKKRTCEIISERERYVPAKAKDDQPVESNLFETVHWRIVG